MASPPSPAQASPSDPPQALFLPPPPKPPSQPPSSSSRRLPPPCWSHEETIALIDSYRDKWYSLRRGNLKATHWQDVADAVTGRCPGASPPKTAVQCRHKMEKLRKRYRTEIQRARSMPVARFTSSWVHFKRMDSMEKGPSQKPEDSDSPVEDDNDELDEEDQDQELYGELKNSSMSNTKSVRKLYRNSITSGSSGAGRDSRPFRIRIPSGVSIAQPGLNHGGGFSSGMSFGTRVLRESGSAKPGIAKKGEREREKEKNPVAEMVSAIRVLGDGFVRMEQMKMEMAKEIETMRMEMEMKRTEMILESQHRIVEAFAKAVSVEKKKKKMKRMASPET